MSSKYRSGPFVISQLISVDSAGPGGFQPYGANYLPVCTNPDINCNVDKSEIWVIAHNKNGWGNNDFATPNPDESPDNFSELSFAQKARFHPPQTLNVDFSKLDPNLNSGVWPAYSKEADVNSLGNSSPNSQWTVPWLPEVDLPVTRFQDGRPGSVKGLKLISLDEKKKSLVLKWDPNPASDHVDEYALYVHGTPCPDDFCYPTLVGTIKGNSFNGSLAFPDPNTGQAPGDKPGVVVVSKGHESVFWVIAHNSRGWGSNDPFAPNPDQSDVNFRYTTKNQQSNYSDFFTQISVDIP